MSYYSKPHVLRRILEFLGGNSVETATCHHLATGDSLAPCFQEPLPVDSLASLLEDDTELYRSLWDHAGLVADLDIEYVNFDHPAEAFLRPERIFDLMRPVEGTLQALFHNAGMNPLHWLSGRGHHFAWRISRHSRVFHRLTELGRKHGAHAQARRPQIAVPDEVEAAFAGLGLVMEHLAHRAKERAAPDCTIPVELTAIETGPGQLGREMISIDISEYGDPLASRTVRVPYSRYLKPLQQWWEIGEDILQQLPALFCIPLHEMNCSDGIRVMRNEERAVDLAENVPAFIPDCGMAMERLLNAYEASPLASFHGYFYSVEQDAPELWPETYDRFRTELLPPCARVALEHPNDLLLQPSRLRLLTRALLALGWHPRHIAGLVRSKFERDYGWGSQWENAVPALRADFYVRIFSGLLAAGPDDLIDFNCKSCQESGLCPVSKCTSNLEWFRHSALERRRYDRMAHRPFNRLFLPQKHL